MERGWEDGSPLRYFSAQKQLKSIKRSVAKASRRRTTRHFLDISDLNITSMTGIQSVLKGGLKKRLKRARRIFVRSFFFSAGSTGDDKRVSPNRGAALFFYTRPVPRRAPTLRSVVAPRVSRGAGRRALRATFAPGFLRPPRRARLRND
jgi:hypothetical protein